MLFFKRKLSKPDFFEPYNLLATCFGVGNSKFMPGTLGSIIGAIFWALLNNFFIYFNIRTELVYLFWLAFLILLFFAGAEACELYHKKTKIVDAKSIIIDEFIGQILLLVITYYFVADDIYYGAIINLTALGYYLLICLILFRVFDITKPAFIGWADQKIKSGYGVMIDDILAAVTSALIFILAITLIEQI